MKNKLKKFIRGLPTILKLTKKINKLEKETLLCLPNANAEEIVKLRLIIESVRRIAEYASDISEVVLNFNVESVLG